MGVSAEARNSNVTVQFDDCTSPAYCRLELIYGSHDHNEQISQADAIVRRRHIKQNKEIIQYAPRPSDHFCKLILCRSNVEQKLASKILREEILGLKAEILRIQQQNARLQHRLVLERRSGRGGLGTVEPEVC